MPTFEWDDLTFKSKLNCSIQNCKLVPENFLTSILHNKQGKLKFVKAFFNDLIFELFIGQLRINIMISDM